MSGYVKITEENVADYPAGTAVEFFWGAMYPKEEGIVTGFEITKWGAHLVAKTNSGDIHTIAGFSSVGIGTYLVKVPETKVNKASPWYRE